MRFVPLTLKKEATDKGSVARRACDRRLQERILPVRASLRAARAARVLALTTAVSLPTAAPAQSYDMDCKLILCLAGGFPLGCADALAYMLDRLRRIPPQPPIGLCTGYDGQSVDLNYGRPSDIDPLSYDCEDPSTKLYFSRNEEANSYRVNAFCYDAEIPDIEMDPDTGRLNVSFADLDMYPPVRINYIFEFAASGDAAQQRIRLNTITGYVRVEEIETDAEDAAEDAAELR